MPDINPALVPTVAPGSVFSKLTTDSTLSVRWLEAVDPLYYSALNRPQADITLRQLIIAKSLDQLGLRVSHQNLFPFLISPTVDVATSKVSLPVSWIWDMHVSVKSKYTHLRLIEIQRISGDNSTTDGYSGKIRLVFGGVVNGGTTVVGLFYADYIIDSALSFQIAKVSEVSASIFSPALPSEETGSIAGYIMFRTLLIEDDSSFFDFIAPPIGATSSTSDGLFDTPATYEMSDSIAGGSDVTGDYSVSALQYGTGVLVVSAYNEIPPSNVDNSSILAALNFPFRLDADLESTDGLSIIPSGLFSSFTMTAPAGDRDTDNLEDNYPVIVSKILRLDASSDSLQIFFSTYNTVIDSTSEELIEFATLTINRSDIGTSGPGTVLEIVPYNNLRNLSDPSQELFHQNFGSGTAILSSNWETDSAIGDFFDSFNSVVDDPAVRYFATLMNEFALARSPNTIPTLGESKALAGTMSSRTNPVFPSNTNRYIVETDSGLGDTINFDSLTDFTANDDIDPIGYTATLVRKQIVLKVNSQNDSNFDYATDILPRLRKLLGRDPIMFDVWFDGTTFKQYDSVSGAWVG